MATAWLCQIDAATRGGGATTLRVASHDDERLCHIDGQVWWPAIARLPRFSYDLFDGAFGGEISAPSGQFELSAEALPGFAAAMLHGRRIRWWSGELGAAWGDYVLRFDGIVDAQPTVRDGRASTAFRVDDRWLDDPILPTYAGTTGAEGEAALKGAVKPLLLGAPRMVEGVLANSVDSMVQLSDGAIAAVDVAMEDAARFAAPVADYPSYAALQAATIAPGFIATALAAGWVRHGAPPAGVLTYDVQGSNSGSDGLGQVRRVGAIVRRIAARMGRTAKVDGAALAAIDVARPWNVSIALTQQTTMRAVAQMLAQSINAVALVTWTGLLTIVPIPAPEDAAAVGTLASDGSSLPPVGNVEQLAISPPFWRMAIEAELTNRVLGNDEIRFTAALVDRGRYDAAETYCEGHIVDLADGSRWLYTAVTPTSGNMPADGSAYWSQMSPPSDRGKLFIRGDAPSAADSNAGDTWQGGDGVYWDRVADIVVSIGTTPVTIGTEPLTITWTPSAVQPVTAVAGAAAAAQAQADAAALSAATANAALADIANDDLLTPGEKSTVLLNVDTINSERAGIVAQAAAFGAATEQAAYEAAVDALSTYLATLTAPVLWLNLTGNTAITGATFRAKFGDVYAARQTLLNKLAAIAKAQADAGVVAAAAAQSAADDAAADATAALAALADIASDNLLTPDEKPRVILDVDVLTGEQAGIDGQAVALGITTEKTAYDDALTALDTYLATLTAPVAWNALTGNTTIVGATFRAKFADVYAAKQALLNAIAGVIKTIADSGVSGAADAQSTADAAASAAATANAALADIASDGVLTPDEKPRVILDRDVLTGEQTGIDAQASALAITTEKTAYDNALTALTTYLATLTTPVLWSNLSGNTDIVGATFRAKFSDVYAARQVLMNKISAALKSLADAASAAAAAAQGTANAASSAAATANAALADIASDSLLTPDEKPRVILDRDVIVGEQAGIDAQATAYSITTEKTAYDNAVSALTTYLATLTAPVLWSNLGGNTTIVGSTFRTKFSDVYAARQAVLNKIAEKAGLVATWGGLSGTGKPEDNADVTSQITGQADIIINADYTGAVTTSLPKVQPYALIRNGTDVTASATWSVTVLSGTIAASFPTAGGLSLDASSGTLTTSTLRITAVYNGTTRTLDVRVSKKLADPPPSGSSSASSGISASIPNTTPVALTGDLPITVAASGNVTLSASYTFTTALSGGSQSMTTEWYEWNGSAWVAIASSQVAASSAYTPVTGEPGEGSNTKGLSGLTPSAAKKYRLYGFNSGGTTSATRNVSGTSSAVSS